MSARALLAVALALAVAVVAACEDSSRPVDPIWGKQACAHCAMLVSDPHFAAQLTTEGGDRLFFDDPGCMASYVRERSPRVRGMWVREASGAWVDGASAHFHADAASPMDFGFQVDSVGTADWSAVQAAAAKRAPARTGGAP